MRKKKYKNKNKKNKLKPTPANRKKKENTHTTLLQHAHTKKGDVKKKEECENSFLEEKKRTTSEKNFLFSFYFFIFRFLTIIFR